MDGAEPLASPGPRRIARKFINIDGPTVGGACGTPVAQSRTDRLAD